MKITKKNLKNTLTQKRNNHPKHKQANNNFSPGSKHTVTHKLHQCVQHVTVLTSYRRLCVNFPWASANRLNVTAPGKHKQASQCAGMPLRGCSTVTTTLRPLWRCNEEVVVQEAELPPPSLLLLLLLLLPPLSVCISLQRSRAQLKNTYLAAMHIHAVMWCCRRLTAPHPPAHLWAPQHLLTVIKS